MSTMLHKNSKNKARRSKFKRTGFTLIEVMIYAFVFSIFLLLITQVFVAVKNSAANSRAVVSLQENYARFHADLAQTISSASEVDLPLIGQSGDVLSLNGGEIIYQITDGVFEKIIGGEPLALSDDRVIIEDLIFERLGTVSQKPSIRIRFSLVSRYLFPGERKITEEFQTVVTLRN